MEFRGIFFFFVLSVCLPVTVTVAKNLNLGHNFEPYEIETSYLACTRVDQKVLKLIAYLFEYTTELYKTYTEYKVNIS